MDTLNQEKKNGSKTPLTPWIVLAVCVLPILASTGLYYLWKPSNFVNNGELIGPTPISQLQLKAVSRDVFSFSELDGGWAFVAIDQNYCDDTCQTKLYLMRQIRLTQGAEKERINRVHLFSGGAIDDAELLTKYDGTIFVSLANVDQLKVFGDESDLSRYIFLVDQIGNLMMRFPVDINPSLMKKDVTKLLKLSKGWKTVN